MAFQYTGTDGLFTHLGKLVKHYDQFESDANHSGTGLAADRDDILDAFQAADHDESVAGLATKFESWKDQYSKRRIEIGKFANKRILERDSVLKELVVAPFDTSDVLAALISKMAVDGESVTSSSVSVSSVTANAGNDGGGTILTTDLLDGATSPGMVGGVRMMPHLNNSRQTTQLASPDESFQLQANSDNKLTWRGLKPGHHHSINGAYSGLVATIPTLHSTTSQYLKNPDFENFTSNAPDDWTVVNGTPGSTIFESTTDVDHGSSSLEMRGNGVLSALTVEQAIDPKSVVANKMYCLTAKLKSAGGSMLPRIITLQFKGTDYTPGTSEKISTLPSAISGAFKLVHCFIVMPAIIPDDFRLEINFGDVPEHNQSLFVDDLGFGPVAYGGGIGIVAVRDSDEFACGDRFELSVSNVEGAFQRFFRRTFGVQLPSSSSSPTISDTLAGIRCFTGGTDHDTMPGSDYSNVAWTLTFDFNMDQLGGTSNVLFAQKDGSGTGRTWLRVLTADGSWQTILGGTLKTFPTGSIPAAVADTRYQGTLVHDPTANELKLTVNGNSHTLTSIVMESADGDFVVGNGKSPSSSNALEGCVYKIELAP